MTVKELIEELKMLNPLSEVRFVCDYGDRSHTQQALIVGCVEEMDEDHFMEESAYSNSGAAVEETFDAVGDEVSRSREITNEDGFVLLS